jgi:hypothetical protein
VLLLLLGDGYLWATLMPCILLLLLLPVIVVVVVALAILDYSRPTEES